MKHMLIAFVRVYRMLFSPWLGGGCRFTPSCSTYALGCLEQHGAAAGSYLAFKRLARCQPWCHGGHDPVPATHPVLSQTPLSSITPLGAPKKSS